MSLHEKGMKGLSPVLSSTQHESLSIELPGDPDAHLNHEEKAEVDRQLVRKLDMWLIPWLCILYLLAFLDRTNIGNAKIAGLATGPNSLHLTTWQYNASLTIFFVSYAVFEPITNVMLKRYRPSIFIPTIMIFWGASMLGMGFVDNWNTLMVARWFLGLAEAGLFPGVNYYLSCWYKRSELGIRAAIFFSAAALSGSFGGLLAALLEKMEGLGGRPGWAWIFIIEGMMTILAGFVSFKLVQDFPTDAKFLCHDDRARVIRRLKMDQNHAAEHESFQTVYFWQAVMDWKMWLGMAIYMGCDMPLYAFSLFLPSIIAGLGWNTSVIKSQMMSVPPYAVAALFTVVVGWFADRTGRRGLCNMVVSLIGVLGFALLLISTDPAVQYAAVFLGALGIYPCISNTITWVANNIEGVYKRGVVLGFVIGWGNLCGIISSNIYFDGPRYLEGHATVMGFMAVFLFGGSVLMTTLLRRENNLRQRGLRNYWTAGKTPQEIDALGDMRPDFVYVL